MPPFLSVSHAPTKHDDNRDQHTIPREGCEWSLDGSVAARSRSHNDRSPFVDGVHVPAEKVFKHTLRKLRPRARRDDACLRQLLNELIDAQARHHVGRCIDSFLLGVDLGDFGEGKGVK